MEKRMFEELKKAYRPEFINRIDEKVIFHSLSSDHMQEVVKIMVKPLVASLAEKGIDLKLQASALKLLANQGYDPEMGSSSTSQNSANRSGGQVGRTSS